MADGCRSPNTEPALSCRRNSKKGSPLRIWSSSRLMSPNTSFLSVRASATALSPNLKFEFAKKRSNRLSRPTAESTGMGSSSGYASPAATSSPL
eukprot:CAMPEP_0181208602 /NCGR_PEP_ID=MMETSP1096-20121128/22211_1 /TAXON_ID=156174 ORGANISM="Chrysochromulina ericina, Strain CCMP281" /NCGR_SAMPLE_ID=MMETSP1096 /ASSEMBLY_ACC=CAM_ASM_000453 /LENGTH=93 /DNA_ID=CAMNT_0023299689 /DNA_START=586 /DNA_END=864 /DNA_ORIENTATION=-